MPGLAPRWTSPAPCTVQRTMAERSKRHRVAGSGVLRFWGPVLTLVSCTARSSPIRGVRLFTLNPLFAAGLLVSASEPAHALKLSSAD